MAKRSGSIYIHLNLWGDSAVVPPDEAICGNEQFVFKVPALLALLGSCLHDNFDFQNSLNQGRSDHIRTYARAYLKYLKNIYFYFFVYGGSYWRKATLQMH